MKQIVLSLMMIGWLGILTACSFRPSVLLNDTACEAPCWRNISPGDTIAKQAEDLIRSMPDVSVDDNQISGGSANPYYADSLFLTFLNRREPKAWVYFWEDTVSLLSFNANNSHLSQFIDKFGEPSEVFIQSTIGDPKVHLTVDIVYSERIICIHHEPTIIYPFRNPDHYTIDSGTNVLEVDFIAPAIERGFLKVGCLGGLDEETYQNESQPWKGYGDYEVYTWE